MQYGTRPTPEPGRKARESERKVTSPDKTVRAFLFMGPQCSVGFRRDRNATRLPREHPSTIIRGNERPGARSTLRRVLFILRSLARRDPHHWGRSLHGDG